MDSLNQEIISQSLKDLAAHKRLYPDYQDNFNLQPKIGRYVLLEELGRGRMGRVYLAHDPFIDRKVAIKASTSPFETLGGNRQIQQMFFNEARAAGRLIHPNIVALYDAMIENNTFYMVMEYIQGKTLKEVCQSESPVSIRDAISIIFQCAKALDYAHGNGIIHRDIKPDNILIAEEGEVKIADFSIAVVGGLSAPEESGCFTGSVFYSPPELLKGEQLTGQSDIFSLGVVMYEMITGVKPFLGDTEVTVFYKILNKDPEPLKNYRKEIPGPLESIVSRAMEKDPSRRYKSGLELASDLSECYDTIRFLDEKIKFGERYNSLKKLHFFSEFANRELNEVIKSAKWLEYETGAKIITEGEIENCFYIIVFGEVAVRNEGTSLASLKQGDCFGEMAYLADTKRTADITALGKTILIKINASIMENTSLGTQNRFYKAFSQTLIKRLIRANKLIAKDFKKDGILLPGTAEEISPKAGDPII